MTMSQYPVKTPVGSVRKVPSVAERIALFNSVTSSPPDEVPEPPKPVSTNIQVAKGSARRSPTMSNATGAIPPTRPPRMVHPPSRGPKPAQRAATPTITKPLTSLRSVARTPSLRELTAKAPLVRSPKKSKVSKPEPRPQDRSFSNDITAPVGVKFPTRRTAPKPDESHSHLSTSQPPSLILSSPSRRAPPPPPSTSTRAGPAPSKIPRCPSAARNRNSPPHSPTKIPRSGRPRTPLSFRSSPSVNNRPGTPIPLDQRPSTPTPPFSMTGLVTQLPTGEMPPVPQLPVFAKGRVRSPTQAQSTGSVVNDEAGCPLGAEADTPLSEMDNPFLTAQEKRLSGIATNGINAELVFTSADSSTMSSPSVTSSNISSACVTNQDVETDSTDHVTKAQKTTTPSAINLSASSSLDHSLPSVVTSDIAPVKAPPTALPPLTSLPSPLSPSTDMLSVKTKRLSHIFPNNSTTNSKPSCTSLLVPSPTVSCRTESSQRMSTASLLGIAEEPTVRGGPASNDISESPSNFSVSSKGTAGFSKGNNSLPVTAPSLFENGIDKSQSSGSTILEGDPVSTQLQLKDAGPTFPAIPSARTKVVRRSRSHAELNKAYQSSGVQNLLGDHPLPTLVATRLSGASDLLLHRKSSLSERSERSMFTVSTRSSGLTTENFGGSEELGILSVSSYRKPSSELSTITRVIYPQQSTCNSNGFGTSVTQITSPIVITRHVPIPTHVEGDHDQNPLVDDTPVYHYSEDVTCRAIFRYFQSLHQNRLPKANKPLPPVPPEDSSFPDLHSLSLGNKDGTNGPSSTLARLLPRSRRKASNSTSTETLDSSPPLTPPSLPSLPPLPSIRPMSILSKADDTRYSILSELSEFASGQSIGGASSTTSGSRLNKRRHVEMELADTEQTYLQDLYVLYEVFYKPCAQRPDLFSPRVMQLLFGNLGQVVACATYLTVLFNMALQEISGQRKRVSECSTVTFRTLAWGDSMEFTPLSPRVAPIREEEEEKMVEPGTSTSAPMSRSPSTVGLTTRITVLPMTQRNVSNPLPPGGRPLQGNLGGRPALEMHGLRSIASVHTYGGVASPPSGPSSITDVGNSAIAVPMSPPPIPPVPTHSHVQASMNTQRYSQSAADMPNSTTHSMDINKNGGDAVGHRTSVASTMMSLVSPGEVAAEKSQELAVPASSTGTKRSILPCPSLVVVHDLLDGLLQEAPHLRVHVADSFRAMAQQVREIYSLYCNNFDTAMLTLNLLQKEDPTAKAFLESQQRLLNGKTHAWDLASLLIKPVQRVLKYPLLFQQLMKLSDEGTRDHEAFMGAYKKAEGIAEHINRVKRRMALVHRMIETNGSIIQFPVRHSNTLAVRKLAQHCSPRKLGISSRILPGYLAIHDVILPHHSHGKHPAKSHQGVRSTPSSPKTGTFAVPSGAPVEPRSRRHKLNHSKSHTNLKATSPAGTVSGSSGLKEFSQTLRLGLAKTLGRSKAPQLDLTGFADQRLDPYQQEAPSAVVPSPLPSVVGLGSNDSLHLGENSLMDLPGTADENSPVIVVSEGAPHPRTPNLPTVLGFGPPSRQDKTSGRNITAVSNGSGRSTTSFIKLLQRFETQLVTAHVFRKQVELWLNGVSQWGTDCCQMGRDCRQFMVLDSVKSDRDKRRAREKPPEAKVISHPMDAMGPHWERRGSVSTTTGGPYSTGYDSNARQGESNAGMVSRRVNRNGSVSICPTAEPSPSGSIISLNSALVSPSQESTLTQATLSPGRRLPSAGMRSPRTTQIGEGTREGRSASFHEVPLAEVIRRTSVSKRQPSAALLPAMQSALSKELGSSMAADGMIQMVQLNQHTRELESVIVPSIRSAVDTHIYPHLQCLVGLFHNPSVIIRKHADRAIDYVRYTTLKQQGDTPLPTEKGLVEAAEEYELLGAQLAQELPEFLRHTTQLFAIVVDKFQAIQRDFYHQCALSLRSCCQFLVKKPGEVRNDNSVTLHQIIQDYRVALNVPSHPNRFAHTPGLKSPHESAGLGQDSGLLSPLGPIPPELRETTSALDLTQWKDDTTSFNMIPIYPSSSATVALSLSERLDRMVDNIKWSVHKTRDPSRRRSPSFGQQPGSANRTPDLSTYAYPNPLEQDDYFTAVHPVRVKTSKSHLSRESSLSRRRAVLIDYGSESGVPENAAMLFRPGGRIDSRNGSLLDDSPKDDSGTAGVQHKEPTSAAAAELEIALGIRPAHAGRDQPGGHGDNPFLTPDEYPSDSGYLTDTFNDPLFNGVGSPTLTQQGGMPQYFFESFSSLNTVTDDTRQPALTLSNDPTPLVSRQNSQRSALGLSVSNYKLPNLTLTRSDSWGLRGSLAITYRQGPMEDPSTKSSHPTAPNGGNPFTDDHACSSTGSSNDTSPVLPFKTLGANPVQFNGVAIYPYVAQSPHELSLAHGDHIEVSWVAKVALDQSVEAQPASQPQCGDVLATEWWWYGKFCQRTGQKGWFPARYAFRQV